MPLYDDSLDVPLKPDGDSTEDPSVAGISQNEHYMKHTVDLGRFFLTFINFGVTAVFSIALLTNAFQMDTIKGQQVFLADRVLQSFTQTPPAEIDMFIKTVYGLDAEVMQMIDNTNLTLPLTLPSMYEISGSNSILRLDSVHCNFMLFSALWIASAFALAMIQIPGAKLLHWNTLRVVVVHGWNLIGLIATVVIFSATTKWGSIPTSNLFYALIGQVMGWTYQYFHMVECTQVHVATLQLHFMDVPEQDPEASTRKKRFFDVNMEMMSSSELQKILYMEFSVVAPMLLVAGMMPGSSGIDEWRVQTVLFSAWTLFALLGLHTRYRKTIQDRDTTSQLTNEKSFVPEDGLDAMGYLMYATIMVYIMLLNAIGTDAIQQPSYITTRIRQCRWGVFILLFVSGALVLETFIKTIRMRFWRPKGQAAQNAEQENVHEYWMIPPFIWNLIIVGIGSFLVNILLFSGISDVNELSIWSK
jgi:hypothetical protein